MRMRTSADAVKTIAPANTNPINLFRTITILSRRLAWHLCGRESAAMLLTYGHSIAAKSAHESALIGLPASNAILAEPG